MVGEERFKEASDPAHLYLALIDLQVQETMLGWKKKKSLIWLLCREEPLGSQQKEKPIQALCVLTGRAAGGGAGWCAKNWVVLTTTPRISSPPTSPILWLKEIKSCRNLIVFITEVFKK